MFRYQQLIIQQEVQFVLKHFLLWEQLEYYYDRSSPIVSDQEFDILKNQIIELEKQYSFLKSESSQS